MLSSVLYVQSMARKVIYSSFHVPNQEALSDFHNPEWSTGLIANTVSNEYDGERKMRALSRKS